MVSDWILRLRSILKRRAVEQELDDELRFHFDRLVDRHLESGLTRDEAVRRARLEFGRFDHIKEEHRDARAIGFIDDLGRDLSYAFRQLRRSPGFALLAILCLGLGIGANTSIFGALNAALLRPLPVSDWDRVMIISRGQNANFSYPDFQDFQARTRLLSSLTASWPMESDLEVAGASEFITAEVVAANYGSVLGITPVLGQWFTSMNPWRSSATPFGKTVWWPGRRPGPAVRIRSAVLHHRRRRTAKFHRRIHAVSNRHLGADPDTPRSSGDVPEPRAAARDGTRPVAPRRHADVHVTVDAIRIGLRVAALGIADPRHDECDRLGGFFRRWESG